MKRTELTSGITPPKFRVGRYVLNEYEAREMIARIAEGTLNYDGIVLIDEDGHKFTFDSDGCSHSDTTVGIRGWDAATRFTKRKLIALRNKNS